MAGLRVLLRELAGAEKDLRVLASNDVGQAGETVSMSEHPDEAHHSGGQIWLPQLQVSLQSCGDNNSDSLLLEAVGVQLQE